MGKGITRRSDFEMARRSKEPRPSRIRDLSAEEVRELTGGGLLRAIPIVKLFDMLRGKSKPSNFSDTAPRDEGS
jgi:hypothetical protein